MKPFHTILATVLNKAWKRPLVLLVFLAVLVTSTGVVLLAVDRFRAPSNRAHQTDAVRPFRFDLASSSAADHPFPAKATEALQVRGGWGILPLRWSSFALPYSAEDGACPRIR